MLNDNDLRILRVMADRIHLQRAWNELEGYRTHSFTVRSAPYPWMWCGFPKPPPPEYVGEASQLASNALRQVDPKAKGYNFGQVRQARDIIGCVIDSLTPRVYA
jgi:hypothetical protein